MEQDNTLSYAVFYPAKRVGYYDPKNLILHDHFPVKRFPPSEKLLRTKEEDFLSVMLDDEINVAIAWMGGQVDENDANSSLELIRSMDTLGYWDILKGNRTQVVGRSDITFLLSRLLQHGIRCYYGPNYSSFSDVFTGDCIESDSADARLSITKKYLTLALTATAPYTIDFAASEIAYDQKPWTLQSGECSGRLIGGNLDTLYDMLRGYDTEGFSVQKGDILLLESIDPQHVRTPTGDIVGMFYEQLKMLKEKGIFDAIDGLILGRSKWPYVFDIRNGYTREIVSNDVEKDYICAAIAQLKCKPFPILANVACSHVTPMITLPLGRHVTLNADTATLTVYPK